MSMTKEEFKQYLEKVDKETLVNYMLNDTDWAIDNDVEVSSPTTFVQDLVDEPAVLAQFILRGNLSLSKAYVLTSTYYDDAKEADSLEELFDDDDIQDFTDYLVDEAEPKDYQDILDEINKEEAQWL